MGQSEIDKLNEQVKEQIKKDTLCALPFIVQALLLKARTGDVEAIRELRLLVIEPLVTKHSSRPIALIPASVQKALGWLDRPALPPAQDFVEGELVNEPQAE